MKKFLALVLSLSLLATSLFGITACTFEDDDLYDDGLTAEELGANPDAPQVTLAHWDSSGSLEGAVINSVLRQFYATHPNGQKIRIKVQIQGMYETTMPTILSSSDSDKPEIIMIPDGSFNAWVVNYRSQFENLDSYIAKSGFDETTLWDGAVSRYKYTNDGGRDKFGEGSVYALPKDVSPNVMFYNKDFFAEKGVTMPTGTDGKAVRLDTAQAKELWKKLIVGEEDKNAVTRRFALANMFPESMVWSAGSDFLNNDRTGFISVTEGSNSLNKRDVEEIQRDVAGFKKAYEYMVSLVDEKLVPDGASFAGGSASSLFLTGKTACYIGGAYDSAQFRNADFDWDITYIPGFTDNINVNGYSGSVGYAMYSGTDPELKDLVYSVIEYFTSSDAQRIMAEMGFNIPLQKSVVNDSTFIDAQRAKKPYNYEVFLESLRYQPSGTWRYVRNNDWRRKLDTEAAKLYQDKNRLSVDDFVNGLPSIINGSL